MVFEMHSGFLKYEPHQFHYQKLVSKTIEGQQVDFSLKNKLAHWPLKYNLSFFELQNDE